MDTPDFRALCAQLVGYLQGRKDNECGWPGEDPEQDLIDATRAALEAVPATPAPVPVAEPRPADKEWFTSFEAWLTREMPAGTVIGDPKLWAPKIARAAMAAYTRPTPITDSSK